MRNEHDFFPCTHTKACNVLWAVYEKGWSQTKAAIVFGLNVGTVNHIIRRKRFSTAVPLPPNDTTLH
jgi:DNA-directed RNA polymerase specialized sigma24 family protein